MTLRHAREKAQPIALTLLRVGVGIIMVVHGWQKATGFSDWHQNLSNMGIPLPDIAAPLAIAGELGGGLGLILGAFTPIAALGVLGSMIVAIFFVHIENGLLAKNGGFEYPLTLALVSLFFIVRGAGPFSVDAVLRRLRTSKEQTEPPAAEGEREARGERPMRPADARG